MALVGRFSFTIHFLRVPGFRTGGIIHDKQSASFAVKDKCDHLFNFRLPISVSGKE